MLHNIITTPIDKISLVLCREIYQDSPLWFFLHVSFSETSSSSLEHASSATQELDDLMQSLSQFKVSEPTSLSVILRINPHYWVTSSHTLPWQLDYQCQLIRILFERKTNSHSIETYELLCFISVATHLRISFLLFLFFGWVDPSPSDSQDSFLCSVFYFLLLSWPSFVDLLRGYIWIGAWNHLDLKNLTLIV